MSSVNQTYKVPEHIAAKLPFRPLAYHARNQIPDSKLEALYELVIVPAHQRVVRDLEKSVNGSDLVI